MNVDELTKTLSSYSSHANTGMSLISSALRPIAFILLGIFFLLEMNNWKKLLESRGQSITKKLFIELIIKYIFSVLFILMSDTILDALVELGTILIKIVNNAVPLQSFLYEFDPGEINGWIEAMIVGLFGKVIQFIANLILLLLIFMRFVELYILKAIAPILVAFFMSDSLRSITINFFKRYIAYVLSGMVLLVVSVVYNYLIQDDILKAVGQASGGDLGAAFASIAKGVMYILMIAGMTRKVKQLVGVG
ncbi:MULTISPECIES: type IV secretion system protein [unclassified Granulicatella]|uniref:type IV secretion system protein n=1 Tax=unclassified Granulicatella TaxID=2630493 RepID=UPI0010730A77|nr:MULTISPECIES: type IV secretion system protein [unclassified Granulicatella]MBF0780599.1 type IV secretion system protein [Granulicatella sp. 19428wC4_WM01]TFU94627.1 conjugal transfer protein TrbL [Granulicatella sp. WM01]